jgi:hypothetical protein
MSKTIRNVAVALGLASIVGAWGCSGEAPDSGDELGTAKAAIVGGTTVPNDNTQPGALSVRLDTSAGICSGVLLTNNWILTATHCFPLGSSSNPPEYNPSTQPFTATGFNSGQVRGGASVARIVRHPSIFDHWPLRQGVDVLMVRMNQPFTVQGSTTALTAAPTPIRVSNVGGLVGQSVTVQGYGNNVCNTGAGTLRTGSLPVDQLGSDLDNHTRTLQFVPFNGVLPANGDSGGGAFRGTGAAMRLVGIDSGGACGQSAGYTSFDGFRSYAMTNLYGGWGQDMGWCQQSNQNILIGDVQGDGRADMVCHDTSTGLLYTSLARQKADGSVPVQGFTGVGAIPERGLFAGTNWQSPAGVDYCKASVGTLHLGDFNADGRSDALCHGHTGQTWIAYGTTGGGFDLFNLWTDSAPAHIFCPPSLGKISVADFSGDGRSDLLCHDGATGHNWIAYGDAAGHLDFTHIWSDTATDFCRDATGTVYVGKFDNNARADLMCHSHATGQTWIAYTGTNFRPDFANLWFSSTNWCSGSSRVMKVGDFDASGRYDLLCHDMTNSETWMALSDATGHPQFSAAGQDLGWCTEPGDELFVGRFNADGRHDLLCNNRADAGQPLRGRQYVIYTGPGGTYQIN